MPPPFQCRQGEAEDGASAGIVPALGALALQLLNPEHHDDGDLHDDNAEDDLNRQPSIGPKVPRERRQSLVGSRGQDVADSIAVSHGACPRAERKANHPGEN
jgi:hypothetical protein